MHILDEKVDNFASVVNSSMLSHYFCDFMVPTCKNKLFLLSCFKFMFNSITSNEWNVGTRNKVSTSVLTKYPRMVKNDVPKTISFKDLCECVCKLITYAFIDEREHSAFRLIDRVL